MHLPASSPKHRWSSPTRRDLQQALLHDQREALCKHPMQPPTLRHLWIKIRVQLNLLERGEQLLRTQEQVSQRAVKLPEAHQVLLRLAGPPPLLLPVFLQGPVDVWNRDPVPSTNCDPNSMQAGCVEPREDVRKPREVLRRPQRVDPSPVVPPVREAFCFIGRHICYPSPAPCAPYPHRKTDMQVQLFEVRGGVPRWAYACAGAVCGRWWSKQVDEWPMVSGTARRA
ncbi:hypothetical protein C8Q73DRAFT_693745 [Cubamyces lactineus]|nr:hypothetical protein C8Q73DRAFT_693745 [Cubamyces lactineus]